MNLMLLFSSPILDQQLHTANRFGWLYAIGGWSNTDNKAGFDAIGSIGGVA